MNDCFTADPYQIHGYKPGPSVSSFLRTGAQAVGSRRDGIELFYLEFEGHVSVGSAFVGVGFNRTGCPRKKADNHAREETAQPRKNALHSLRQLSRRICDF